MLAIAASLLFVCTPALSTPINDEDDENSDVIVINPDEYNSQGGHNRAPALIPIDAVFMRIPSIIHIGLIYPIENLSTQLTNLSTGQTLTFSIGDATDCIIPVSLGTGPYRIDFLINNGTYYYGYFNN